MKKIFTLLLAVVMAVSAYIPSSADEGGVSVHLNGTQISYSESDGQPQIISGRAYVPLRRTCDALGIDIDYNANTKVLKITKNDSTVTHTIGTRVLKSSENYYYGTSDDDYSLVSIVQNGRVLMPIRLLADSIDCFAYWDSDIRSVILKSETDSADGEYVGKWFYDNTWIADGWGGIGMPLNVTISYCDSETIQGEYITQAPDNNDNRRLNVVPFSSQLYTDSSGITCSNAGTSYDYDLDMTIMLKYKDGEPIIQFKEWFYLVKE
ncbi:MAG: copper amine oxidase N-terminal domain-containing protein [Clostridiales bacterium]|nr:copper amine oxidase N-terminal domain-containing protein [Clostridiales bacterium]